MSWIHVAQIIEALGAEFVNPTVGIRKEGPAYRAQLVGIFRNGNTPIESPCRPTPEEAVKVLYDIVVEMTFKDFRPVQSKLQRLGFVVDEPTLTTNAEEK